MPRSLVAIILAMVLLVTWGGISAAGEAYSLRKAYNMDKAEQGFAEPPAKTEPNASVVAADAILGRPLGLATTIVGTGVFLVTLPFSWPSHSVETAGWGLVGRPAGWTFNRPLGRGKLEYEERGIFK
jgi:hypothetical protein